VKGKRTDKRVHKTTLYKFLEGRLVDTESGDGFNFYVSEDQRYNQRNYEMLGEVYDRTCKFEE
jgi:hypothetical protein